LRWFGLILLRLRLFRLRFVSLRLRRFGLLGLGLFGLGLFGLSLFGLSFCLWLRCCTGWRFRGSRSRFVIANAFRRGLVALIATGWVAGTILGG
jgi:hypothetical protein